MRRYGGNEMEEGNAPGVRCSQCLSDAVKEYGGKNTSAAVKYLGIMFDCYVDESILCADEGIFFPGVFSEGSPEAMEDWGAYVGVSQFLSVLAHRNGKSREDVWKLCRGWRDCFEQAAFKRVLHFEEILSLGCAYIDQHLTQTGWTKSREQKPKQYYENIFADRESMFLHSPFALEEKLTRAVSRGKRREALQALHEITVRGEKAVLAKNPLRSAKNSMIGSIAFLSRAAIQAGVASDDAFALSDALTQRVEEMQSKSTVLAFEEHILLQFIDLVQQRLKVAYSVPVMRAVHYLENRLDKKITLTDAAAYAGVHPAYLSARFKKETGTSFRVYAATRKIQESTYFVRHTDYSMAQIASLYGFSSQSYYITTFKRTMNMTPAEYRRRFLV